MSSSVHFRFKSAREFETLSFEGDFLKVADLKVAIVERKKLNFGEGFDLEISDASTSDVFNDESALVQKNTSVIVRRIPGLKQGGILSHQEMAAKNERYAEKQGTKPQQRTTPSADHNPVLPKTIEGSDEAERIASLVMQSNVQYDQFPPPTRGRHPNRSANRGRSSGFSSARTPHGQSSFQSLGLPGSAYPERAPKPSSNYVCHRCNRPGHWIDQCPTNGNPAYDRIKVRAPTGIPRSMLRQVDAPESGTGLQDSSGHFVTLQPNEEEFARQTVGLRLSQAAASAGDSKPDVKTERGIGEAKHGPNDTPGAVSEQGAHDNKDGTKERNVQSHASQQQKRSKHTNNGGQLSAKGNGETTGQKAEKGTTDSTNEPDSTKENPSKFQLPEDSMKPKEANSLRAPGNKPTLATRKGPTQLPSQQGIPHILPVPPIPAGFPPMGMPPIPSGMPPIPPQVLMAMAFANQPNGQSSRHPPGIPPNMPMPFTSSPPSTSDVKRKDNVSRTHEKVPEKQEKPSHGKNLLEMDDKMTFDGKISRSGVEQTREARGSSKVSDRGDSWRASRDKSYPLSEKIGFASHSKHDSSSTRAKQADKGRIRDSENSSYGPEGGIPSDRFSDPRGKTIPSLSYNRREISRNGSPPTMPVQNVPGKRSRSPARGDRPNRADRSFASLSPKRRSAAKGRDEYHLRFNRREPRHGVKPSYNYRENTPRDDESSEREFSGRRRAQSPSRGKDGINGTMSPDISDPRSRSRMGHKRFSPSRHPHGDDSRVCYRQESPDSKIWRGSTPEKRFRSTSPPRSGGHNGRNREDLHARSLRGSDRGETDREFEARRSDDADRAHLKSVDRSTRKMSKLEKNYRSRPEDNWDVSRQAEDRWNTSRDKTRERSSPESGGESLGYRAAAADSRRKRERNGRPDSEYRDIKKQRKHEEGHRTRFQRDDMRDRRVSVHDRLGRPVDSRRRKEQKRSVHDRLG